MKLEYRPVLFMRILEKVLPPRLFYSYYPPYFFAGIRVLQADSLLRHVRVTLKRHFFSQNYLGYHFGGSLYAMVDPFYMLMLIKNLGPGYVVWDTAASIRFIKAVKEPVYAEFHMEDEEITQLKQELETVRKMTRLYHVEVVTESGEVVAEVEKEIYIRRMRR